MILELVKTIKDATKLNVYAFAAPRVEQCVVYNYTPLSDNGAKATARVEVRVIAFTLAEALEIKSKVLNALMAAGDGSKLKQVTKLEVSGGGSLEELTSKTTHLFFNLNITIKSEVE